MFCLVLDHRRTWSGACFRGLCHHWLSPLGVSNAEPNNAARLRPSDIFDGYDSPLIHISLRSKSSKKMSPTLPTHSFNKKGVFSTILLIPGIAAINMQPGAAETTVAVSGTSPDKIGVKQILKNSQILAGVDTSANAIILRTQQALQAGTIGFWPEVILRSCEVYVQYSQPFSKLRVSVRRTYIS